MGERAIIERGMDALETIGQGESTTFVIPQELTSLLGRYGKGLTGSDVATNGSHLESLDFDAETRELIGLDDIGEIDDAAQVDIEDLEQQARAVKEGSEATAASSDTTTEEPHEPEAEAEPEL
jgi:hypothetical protein